MFARFRSFVVEDVRLHRAVVSAVVLLLSAPAAAAEPAERFAVPTGPQTDALDDPTFALPTRSVPRTEPVSAPEGRGTTLTAEPRQQRLGNKILYVNFDGGKLSACNGSSPQQNCSSIFSGTIVPYSGDAGRRAAIIQVLRKRFEDFGITVTDQRPANGDYDMEMVGNWMGANPPFAGIAPAGDCWDDDGGEISFTLEKSETTDGMAEIILQEVAHTWGLDHVDEQQDLLFPTTAGQNKTFRDECYQVVSDTNLSPASGFCSHHQQACGSLQRQNSYRELLLIFGESVPDSAAPTATIVSPASGATVGEKFELVLELQDDQRPAVMNLEILIDGEVFEAPLELDGAYATPASLSFPVDLTGSLPEGQHELALSITARDESSNEASAFSDFTIDVPVRPGPASTGSDGSGGADDGGGTEGTSEGGGVLESDGSGSADDDASGSTGAAADEDAAGCSCRESSSMPAAGLALFLLLGLRRSASRPPGRTAS